MAVVLALTVLAWFAQQSRLARTAQLAVPQGSFPELYVQMDVGSDPGSERRKCLVSSRSGTTLKRSESRLAKASWRCWVTGSVGAPVVVADSKTEPSSLLVPHTAVSDLAFPLVYEVARNEESETWPRMRWVHFFYERQFRGLYLQIDLPGRFFAAEHGLGRPELLAVEGDRLVCFDRKMRPVCPTYVLAVADAVFPEPRRSTAGTMLEALLGEGQRTYVLSDVDYSRLEPFPIPVALAGVLETDETFVDQRYRRWLDGAAEAGEEGRFPPSIVARAAAEAPAIRAALEAMGPSLDASCTVLECDAAAERERLSQGPASAWLETVFEGGSETGE